MNFALILLVLVIVTGIAWVFDKLVFEKQRRRAADAAVADFDQQQARLEPRFADEHARSGKCVGLERIGHGAHLLHYTMRARQVVRHGVVERHVAV